MTNDSFYVGDRVIYNGEGFNRSPRPGTITSIDHDQNKPVEVQWDAVTEHGRKTIARYKYDDLGRTFRVGDHVVVSYPSNSELRGVVERVSEAGENCRVVLGGVGPRWFNISDLSHNEQTAHPQLLRNGWTLVESKENGYRFYDRMLPDESDAEWIEVHPNGDCGYGVGNLRVTLRQGHETIIRQFGPPRTTRDTKESVDRAIRSIEKRAIGYDNTIYEAADMLRRYQETLEG